MLDLLKEVLHKHLAPYIESLWDSVVFWRWVALAAVTSLVLIIAFRRGLIVLINKPGQLEHDKRIFERYDKVMSERDLTALCETLANEDSFWGEDMKKVERFMSLFEEEGNQFLTRKIKKAAVSLVGELRCLRRFTATNLFFDTQFARFDEARYLLQPEWKGLPTDEGRRYTQLSEELLTLAGRAKHSYRCYRSRVKELLHT